MHHYRHTFIHTYIHTYIETHKSECVCMFAYKHLKTNVHQISRRKYLKIEVPRNPNRRGRLSTKEKTPPSTNYFRSAHFYTKISFAFVTKQATLRWRSSVLSLSLQLVFPGSAIIELNNLSGIGSSSMKSSYSFAQKFAPPGACTMKLFTAVIYGFS